MWRSLPSRIVFEIRKSMCKMLYFVCTNLPAGPLETSCHWKTAVTVVLIILISNSFLSTNQYKLRKTFLQIETPVFDRTKKKQGCVCVDFQKGKRYCWFSDCYSCYTTCLRYLTFYIQLCVSSWQDTLLWVHVSDHNEHQLLLCQTKARQTLNTPKQSEGVLGLIATSSIEIRVFQNGRRLAECQGHRVASAREWKHHTLQVLKYLHPSSSSVELPSFSRCLVAVG